MDMRVLKRLLLPTPIRNNRKIIDSDTSKPPLKPTVLWNCYFFLKSHFELRYTGSVTLLCSFNKYVENSFFESKERKIYFLQGNLWPQFYLENTSEICLHSLNHSFLCARCILLFNVSSMSSVFTRRNLSL